jgi:4-carboxymuconolactone decarboxylase
MARIPAVTSSQAGLKTKLILRFGPKMMKKLTGRRPENGLEPIAIYAHAPELLGGVLKIEQATAKANRVDNGLKNLAQLKASTIIGCEYCIDLGSQVARRSGLSDDKLLALSRHRDSGLFSELEMLVLDYAAAMTRTPVEVSDELFAALRERLNEAQMVELTSVIALENMRSRFNWALDVTAAGFSEGMVCAVPEPSSAVAGTGLAVGSR